MITHMGGKSQVVRDLWDEVASQPVQDLAGIERALPLLADLAAACVEQISVSAVGCSPAMTSVAGGRSGTVYAVSVIRRSSDELAAALELADRHLGRILDLVHHLRLQSAS